MLFPDIFILFCASFCLVFSHDARIAPSNETEICIKIERKYY